MQEFYEKMGEVKNMAEKASKERESFLRKQSLAEEEIRTLRETIQQVSQELITIF